MPEEIVPVFKIEIDGREITDDITTQIIKTVYEEDINAASMFTIELLIADFIKGDWKFVDLGTFRLGKEIKLYMGMDDARLMMTGEITSIKPSFRSGNVSTIEIRGYDRLHRLRFGTKRRTFVKMSSSDIATMIASDWGLGAKVENTETVHPFLYQNNQSDIEFLLHMAKNIRYEVSVDDKTLHFRKPKENESKSLTLEFMVDLVDFSVELSARYQGNEFTVQGWDYMKKMEISKKATDLNRISMMSANETGTKMTKSAYGSSSSYIVDEQLVDSSHAEKLAIASYNAHLVETVRGEGSCSGNALLRAGKTVEIKGLGRFSGIYYVTSTAHTIDNDGYNTSFKVRRVGV